MRRLAAAFTFSAEVERRFIERVDRSVAGLITYNDNREIIQRATKISNIEVVAVDVDK